MKQFRPGTEVKIVSATPISIELLDSSAAGRNTCLSDKSFNIGLLVALGYDLFCKISIDKKQAGCALQSKRAFAPRTRPAIFFFPRLTADIWIDAGSCFSSYWNIVNLTVSRFLCDLSMRCHKTEIAIPMNERSNVRQAALILED